MIEVRRVVHRPFLEAVAEIRQKSATLQVGVVATDDRNQLVAENAATAEEIEDEHVVPQKTAFLNGVVAQGGSDRLLQRRFGEEAAVAAIGVVAHVDADRHTVASDLNDQVKSRLLGKTPSSC